ncbi:MAG: amidase domain-containing protein [Gracilibacteraceae bacterium]|jgi:hypothetical protein|nr:amidase domain-containing protein [Gracilibacteraceae bacterium]
MDAEKRTWIKAKLSNLKWRGGVKAALLTLTVACICMSAAAHLLASPKPPAPALAPAAVSLSGWTEAAGAKGGAAPGRAGAFFSAEAPASIEAPAPAAATAGAPAEAAASAEAEASAAVEAPAGDLAGAGAVPPQRGGVFIESAETAALTPAEQDLILAHMDYYYTSLAELKVKDPALLFTADATLAANADRVVWEYLIGVRSLGQADLSLISWRYWLNVRSAERGPDGSLTVTLTERARQNFAAAPETTTDSFDIRHIYILQNTAAGPKLTQHFQTGSLYRLVLGDYMRLARSRLPQLSSAGSGSAASASTSALPPALTEAEAEVYLATRLASMLTQAKSDGAARLTQGSARAVTATHAYNREAAKAYADAWVGQRNKQWTDYSSLGGNCQNYLSQCLLAGGAPMDTSGGAVWYWRADSRRAPSWTAVTYFLDYARRNTGPGLAALADAPYYSGEIGDAILLGDESGWRHIVVVTALVRDGEGRVIDYLVHSNTVEWKYFPVSAYPYTRQMLIHIAGWN